MIIERKVNIKNYKCFGPAEQGFQRLMPINILIGKNNSGKSTLIDLIQYLFEPSKDILETKSRNSTCLVNLLLNDTIIEEVIDHYARTNNQSKELWDANIRDYCKNFIPNNEVNFLYQSSGEILLLNNSNRYGQYEKSFHEIFINPFINKQFRRLAAERDVLPQALFTKSDLDINGGNATSIIWKYLNIKNYDQNLIKKDFLSSLNQITKPEIEFRDIHVKEEETTARQSAIGEIFFEDFDGTWVALSKMGSGIKTIILVLLNLIVIPESSGFKKERFVFAFEELENNLHPSLQRRLFHYISEYANLNNCNIFITTHSNIAIDLFFGAKNAQILHVQKIERESYVKTIQSEIEGRILLKDLDYKPSDILLSNGVIWVEGPSDTIYIELFITLYLKELNHNKKFNYCILSLSTSIWKYAGFNDFDWRQVDISIENEIISLAKINHNHLLVIDNDGNYDNIKPSNFEQFENTIGKQKARLIHKSLQFQNHDENDLQNNFGDSLTGTLYYWINDWTIESYLQHFVLTKGKCFGKYFNLNSSTNFFEKKREGENYSKSKVELAREISAFALQNEITFNDFAPSGSQLENKIKRLFATINIWNT
jgi:putative ATP-dependent endonuclease of the OLD family